MHALIERETLALPMGKSLAAAIALITTSGCNFFFGLEDTKAVDAPRPDAIPYAALLYAVPTAVALPGGTGDPTGVAFVPIPGADVRVRVGPPAGPLEEVTYDGETGAISVPDALITAPWRLEYTLGGVVHELLWKPNRDVGKAIVPAFGGVGRPAMPGGAGYAITPTRMTPPAAPAAMTDGRAYLTGVWAAIDVGATAVPVAVSLDRIAPRVGGTGRLDPSKGDQVVLVDYAPSNGCNLAKGVGAASAPDPTSSNIPVSMPWVFTQQAVAFFTYQDTGVSASLRVVDALAGRAGVDQTFTSYGYSAEIGMPAFVLDLGGNPPAPAFIELARCTGTPATTPQPPMPVFANPIALDAYPRMAHLSIHNTRASSANGPGLTSGVEAVAMSPGDSSMGTPLGLDLRLPFAATPKLEGPNGMHDLDTAADQAPFVVGTDRVTLTFTLGPPAPQDLPDYLEVTLYRVVNSPDPVQRGLFVERVYTNADASAPPSFTMDATAFVKGAEYVFALRGYRGRPSASSGDFTQVQNPQTVTTIFTRTFVAQ